MNLETMVRVVQQWRAHAKRILVCTLGILAAIWVGYLLLSWGCSRRLAHEGPSWSPSSAAGWAMAKYDANGDGSIGPGELERSPGLNACLPRADLNRNGRLEREEITARISFYRDCREVRLPCTCVVMLDDKPLGGASVRLVPDPSIAWTIRAAAGVTGEEDGRAVLRVEGDPKPGIFPGIYNVQISKKDDQGNELVPEKYNAQTTLGFEAAPDAGPESLEARFELTSPQEPQVPHTAAP